MMMRKEEDEGEREDEINDRTADGRKEKGEREEE